MPPLIILVIAFGIGAHVGGRKHAAKGTTVTLDQGLPVSLRTEIIRALVEDPNPKSLKAFGDQMATDYPLAAYELRCRAWVLGGRQGDCPKLEAS